MDIPRLGKPSITRIKLNGWTTLLLALAALVVLGAVLLQTSGSGVEFPKLAHKTSVFTADDGTVSIFSRDVYLGRPIADGLQSATKWLTVAGAFVFNPISDGIENAIHWIKKILLWIPWPVLVLGMTLLALRLAGVGVSLFTVFALVLIGLCGLWPSSMETIALMVTAVAISVALAIPLGIMAARSDKVDALMRPILDAMQTMPSFVYLVPVIFFFGLGNAPAVVATIVYAIPPAIRLTNLGIRQVPSETVEAARAFGANPKQLLLKVQLPLALPTIMAGINQTIMMALAMVVIASMVSAGGLGQDVLTAIGGLKVGDAIVAGTAIVFLAIIIDRITQGIAQAQAKATQA